MDTSVKRITLHQLHENLGAKMVPFAGYYMPVRYSSDLEEHLQVRKSVGVFDISHMGEFMIEGSQALELIQQITSNDASVLVDGAVQYSCFTNNLGGIIDDLLVYRISAKAYMLVVNASNIDKDWRLVCENVENKQVTIKNISEQTSLFAVQGPNAKNLIAKLFPEKIVALPYYHFAKTTCEDIGEIIISATGYTGAGGFEIYVSNDFASVIWSKIMEFGSEFGILPIGLATRDTLRLEMGYCLYGNDINDQTTPLEAGLGWITKFTKNFTGKEVLEKQKAEGVNKKLIGLKMLEKGIPRAGYPILTNQDQVIGEVTSGTISPMLNTGIAMAYLDKAQAKLGQKVFVEIRNKLFEAEVVKFPFVKDSLS